MDIQGKRRISLLDMKIVKMCNWIMIAYYILRNIICINQITVINFHVYLPKFFPSKFAVKKIIGLCMTLMDIWKNHGL